MKNKSKIFSLGFAGVMLLVGCAMLALRSSRSAAFPPSHQKAESRASEGPNSAAPRLAMSPGPTASAAAATNPAIASDQLRELRRRLDDPQQRLAALQNAQMQVAQRKGRLFLRLKHVPSDKLERLKTILAEKDVELQQRMLPDPDNPNLDANTVLQQTEAECASQVKLLLGDEDYAIFAAYQQSEPYRESMQKVTSIMQSQGVALPDDQQEALLDAYAQATYAATQDAVKDRNPVNATASAVRALQMGRFDQYLAANAAKILDADHFKLFMAAEYAQEGGNP